MGCEKGGFALGKSENGYRFGPKCGGLEGEESGRRVGGEWAPPGGSDDAMWRRLNRSQEVGFESRRQGSLPTDWRKAEGDTPLWRVKKWWNDDWSAKCSVSAI